MSPTVSFLECVSCHKATTLLEAELRYFNTGRCGFCGGTLYAVPEPKEYPMPSANYLDENDRLAEAGRILRGETMMIPTADHLKAMQQLVVVGHSLNDVGMAFPGLPTVTQADWLREAAKVLPR